MKTGLTKQAKTTEIRFDERSPLITVCTYNTSLKNRLAAYALRFPNLCKQIDDDGLGCLVFEIEKGRFCFRLTAPYSDERQRAASEAAKKNGVNRQKVILDNAYSERMDEYAGHDKRHPSDERPSTEDNPKIW